MQKYRQQSPTLFVNAMMLILLAALPRVLHPTRVSAEPMVRLQYNHPGLVVDLGVGLWAWPLPMDWDQDGDLVLVVSCPDVPFRGTYLFENPGGDAKTIELGHEHIRDHQLWAVLLDQTDGLLAIGRLEHLDAVGRQQGPQHHALDPVVIDDQGTLELAHASSRTAAAIRYLPSIADLSES